MAGPNEPTTKGDSGAESPTTARPLEMDDDDVQDTSVIGGGPEAGSTTTAAAETTTSSNSPPTKTTTTEATTDAPAAAAAAPAATADKPKPASVEATDDAEAPPAKPPRPPTEAQKNELILKEAFPGVDAAVVKAVLSASGGNVERAFNALLQMTDPEAAQNEPEPATEAAPPPQPPRPQGRGAQLSQLEADELYARQLAEQYDNVGRAYEARTAAGANQGRYRGDGRPREPRRDSDDEHEYSFIDDELPVIRDQLRQGFFETQTKVNGWISTLRKRIEDSFDESEDPHHGHGGPQGQQAQGRYRPGESANSRRSGDYDADPQVLGDDFAGMRLSADGTPLNRTSAYRHQSASPRPSSGRRVGFKDEPEEINMYERSPPVPPKDSSASTGPAPKASKWQPLSTVAPQPIGDNDPFSLGDSDDEKDNNNSSKDTATASKDAGSKDATDDSSERLKKAAAEAMSDNLVDDDKSKK